MAADAPDTDPLVGSVEPFRRPRRLTEKSMIRRYEARRAGDCYAYAVREIQAWSDAGSPAPQMVVVHGIVAGAARIDHAWVERGGFAYDWQDLAVHGLKPTPVAAFRARKEAVPRETYDAASVAKNVLQKGHYGPWEETK